MTDDALNAAADDVRYAGGNGTSDYWRGFNDGIDKLVERLAAHPADGEGLRERNIEQHESGLHTVYGAWPDCPRCAALATPSSPSPETAQETVDTPGKKETP